MAEVIVLKRLSELPGGAMVQASPMTEQEARLWASGRQAERVWYWEKTRSAFVLAG